MIFDQTKRHTAQLNNLFSVSEKLGINLPLSRNDANDLISASDPKSRSTLIMLIIDLVFDLIMERSRSVR